jgi:hypothetical protein
MRTHILFACIPSLPRKLFIGAGNVFKETCKLKHTSFDSYDLTVLEINRKEQMRQNCYVMRTFSNLLIFISVSIVFFVTLFLCLLTSTS